LESSFWFQNLGWNFSDDSTHLAVIFFLFVPDMPDDKGLGIWGKPEYVVVGDNFTLHCGATKYNYTEPLSWFEYRDGYRVEQLVQNNSGNFS
jgi:hypothetical protein